MYHQIYERLNMKTIIFIAFIAFAAAEPDFENFFENLDLDSLLKDDEYLEELVNCVLDKGSCTELFDSYKDLFLAAVKEECGQCTPRQKGLFWLFISRMKSHLPEDYTSFKEKYDPEDKYFDNLEWALQNS